MRNIVSVILSALLTIQILCSFARYYWPFELLTHFRVYYFFSSFLILFLAIFLRAKKLIIMALLAIFITQLIYITPYLPLKSRLTDSDLIVLSHNFNRHNENFDKLREIIGGADPDMFLIMEVTSGFNNEISYYKNTYPYYHFIPDDEGSFGMFMASKYPAEFQVVDITNHPVLQADITVNDKIIYFIGFHPIPPVNKACMDERNEDMRNFADYLQSIEGNIIVAGDFNSTMWSPYFGDLIAKSDLKDTRLGFGIYPTWAMTSWFVRIPIDYILVSENFDVDYFQTGDKIGSDHSPVIAGLGFENTD